MKDESGRTDTPASQIPVRKLNFIRSSFSTPFNTNEKKRNSNSTGNKRKSRPSNFSEDEAISTGESSSDSDAAATASTRSSKRRRTTNPKYDFKDIQTSDEENKVSADSDGGYDPVADKEKKEAKRDKRDLVRKAKVQEEDDVAEEA